MALIEIHIEGLDRVAAALNQLAGWKVGLPEEVGALMKRQHEDRILSEKTSPDGAAWAPLAESTVRKKGSSEILIETMQMASAFTVSAGGDIVRLGNPTPYGPFHQMGTSNMPARPFMGLSQRNISEIERLIMARFQSIMG